MLIIKGAGPSLLGKDWLSSIRLPWQQSLYKIQTDSTDLQHLLKKHASVLKDELGSAKGFTAKIHVEEKAKPLFCKARPVHCALRGKVNTEIDRLTREGVIEPVEFADWEAPIVPVVKTDGSVRLCGDYKVTITQSFYQTYQLH